MKGGYINVNCEGLDLIKGLTEQTIDGLFARSKDALKSNKPIFCVNANWDGSDMSPIQCFGWLASDSLIIFTASTFQIYVTSADKVTIHNMLA